MFFKEKNALHYPEIALQNHKSAAFCNKNKASKPFKSTAKSS